MKTNSMNVLEQWYESQDYTYNYNDEFHLSFDLIYTLDVSENVWKTYESDFSTSQS